jgi:hypothetical protein
MRIINEEEFINLVKLILFYQNNIEEYTFKFLSIIIDPFNNKKIAFSDMLHFLGWKN